MRRTRQLPQRPCLPLHLIPKPHTNRRCLQAILGLHSGHSREGGDSIFSAYEHGAFSKVAEMVSFKERMAASHSLYQAEVEEAARTLREAALVHEGDALERAARAIATHKSNMYPGESKPDIDGVCFNEDLSTRPAWLPPPGRVPATLRTLRQQFAASHEPPCHAWWRQSPGSPAPNGCEEARIAWEELQRNLLEERQAIPTALLEALVGRRRLQDDYSSSEESEDEDLPQVAGAERGPFWTRVSGIAEGVWSSRKRAGLERAVADFQTYCEQELEPLEEALARFEGKDKPEDVVALVCSTVHGEHTAFLAEQAPWLGHCVQARVGWARGRLLTE